MARWRLTYKHYINVESFQGTPVEWEHSETDRASGRVMRKRYPVPCFLDPENPGDCNYPGEIVVAQGDGAHQRNDIIFFGEPTPDMEPLDEEAETISASLRSKWIHPVESLPLHGIDYGQSLIASFERQMKDIIQQQGQPQNSSLKTVSVDEFEELKTQMRTLMEQNAALMNQLADKSEAEPQGRRV